MQLCIACSATLNSSHSTPTNSEKPAYPTSFICGHSVCPNCTTRRRNLAKSCILCESVHEILSSSSTSTSNPTSRSTLNPPNYTRDQEKQDGFVLGDDSDDEGSELPPPPPLETFDPDQPPAYNDSTDDHHNDKHDNEKGTKREQSNLHYIKPDETLLGLSMKYGVEGPLMCQMNRLPISTLSTTPHLLHTLPFLILPPSARPSTSTEPLLPPFEERKRLLIRRFQIATRCTDYNVAKAYIDQVLKAREEEAEFVRRNRGARSDQEVVEVREGGELEEAKMSYEADERWEREQREGKGKGKGFFGSKIRSTGEVENKVKTGWSWR